MSAYSVEDFPDIDSHLLEQLNSLVELYGTQVTPEAFSEAMVGYLKGVDWVLKKYGSVLQSGDHPDIRIGRHMTACHLLATGQVLLGINVEEFDRAEVGKLYTKLIGKFKIENLTLVQLFEALAVQECTHWVAMKYPDETGLTTYSPLRQIMDPRSSDPEEYHLQPHELEALENEVEYFENVYPDSVPTKDLRALFATLKARNAVNEAAETARRLLDKGGK